MSELEVSKITGKNGVLRIAGQLAFDQKQNIGLGPINDIGIAGNQGFGVGVSPSEFDGYSTMSGTFDPASANYGNYRYSDGSIMVWIPAFFYKIGTGANGVALNRIDIKNFDAYASVAAANSAGYALHRAFYDGGQIKPGFFIDKFMPSNNAGIASSLPFGLPLSTDAAHNPIGGLTGAPSNTYGGTFSAAKTRGDQFFPASGFMWSALAMLAKAHGDASTGTAFCAWYNPSANFPKGNNNSALGDVNDGLLSFISDGYTVSGATPAKSGSGSVMAKTTHNGQSCGVTDVNGNMWKTSPGITSDGTNFYILKTTVSMKTLTGGSTLATDAFGATGIAANYDSLGPTFLSLLGSNTVVRYGNGANQVFSEAVSGNDWAATGFGVARALGVSAGGSTEFGNDFLFDFRPNECFPLSGGHWADGSAAGVWARVLSAVRGSSDITVGFCSASFGS